MTYLIIILILLVVLMFKFKVKIKLKSFLKKGFLPSRGKFGIYCYCGKQGKGKTYSVVEYMLDNKKNSIYLCNVGGISNVDYFLFTGFKELIYLKEIIDYNFTDNDDLFKFINDRFNIIRSEKLLYLILDYKKNNKQLVFVYDEIFTELQKKSVISKDVMDFLCQMRKRKIIFLTTAQEWAEIPLTFRRFCRFEIDCQMLNLFVVGVLIKNFKDAENMKWSDEDQEFIAPLISNTVTKCRKNVATSYDTFLRISSASVDVPFSNVTPEGEGKCN